MFAVKIVAENDKDGNPRRGWIICEDSGLVIDFVDEGCEGNKALLQKGYAFHASPVINVSAKEYRSWKKIAK